MNKKPSIGFTALAVATIIASVAIGYRDPFSSIVGISKNSQRKKIVVRATESGDYSFVCQKCERENIVSRKPKKKVLCKFCGQ